jgi:transposase, IS5 family
MSGQIVDASLVSAPKQRNTDDEKKAIEDGRIPENWKAKPAKLRQKVEPWVAIGSRPMANDARWTLVFGKARLREDGTRHADIAIPVFGHKSLAGIDRRHGFIRKWDVTDASRHDGRMLRRGQLDGTNTGTTVWPVSR